MFCSNCGKEIDENVKFCSNCGAEIGVVISKEDNNKSKKNESKKNTNTNVWVAMILTVIGFIISFFPLWNIIFFIVIIFSLKLNINVWSKKNKLLGTIGIVISIVAVIVTVCMYLELPKYRKIATIEGMDKKVSANMINEEYYHNPSKASDTYWRKKVTFIGTVESYDTYIPTHGNDYRCVVAIKFKEGWCLEVPESSCDTSKLDEGTKLEVTSIIQDFDGYKGMYVNVYDDTTRSIKTLSDTIVKLNGENFCINN